MAVVATTSSFLRRPLLANLCIVALWLSMLTGLCQPESAVAAAAADAYESAANSPGLPQRLLGGVQAWPVRSSDHRLDSDESESRDLRLGQSSPAATSSSTEPENRERTAPIAHRMSRGALDRNFLRFGRGGLNKNFLRFGRGGLNKNFLRFGRGGLDRNFLRFGRGGLNKNFLRFGRRDTDDNNNEESSATYSTSGETGSPLDWMLNPATSNVGAEPQQQSEPEIDHEDQKRGLLNLNFPLYGNLLRSNLSGGKRNSLDRNFLRFGKRSSINPHASEVNENEQESEAERNKSTLDGADDDENEADHRTKRGVMLLTAPWMKRELAPHHGGGIRRRSLKENFIRFGRR